MRKLSFSLLIALLFVLAACNNDVESAPNEQGTLTADLVPELVQTYGLSEDDILHRAELVDGTIQIDVSLAPFGNLSDETLAQTFYSSISEVFLMYSEGWERLAVYFEELDHTVMLHYAEHMTDSLGKRTFPLVRIEEKMNERS
ncbi:hypothetical protein [Savagea faecisuis]|uniref:Uncharacterized protein n=1 Tax=Savagea faecisuis TaxID=1274803 RepID=A0ABW3GUG7_9BACL